VVDVGEATTVHRVATVVARVLVVEEVRRLGTWGAAT
jgi:hypothetical protein